MSKRMQGLLLPLLAIITGLILGGIIMWISGYKPLNAYIALFQGAFGNSVFIANTIAGAIPLIFTSLGIAIAFRTGLFNIGAEGQYWVGAMVGVWIGYHFSSLPWYLHIPFALVGAMLAGGLWGGVIPGLAKAYVGAHEVITTMMMSYIAILIGHFMLERGPMMAPGFNPQSLPVTATATLPILVSNSNLSTGLYIALAAIVIVYLLLFYTSFGYRLRTVGYNPMAARYAGMKVPLYTIYSLGLSGVFAGLGGAVQMMGVDHQLTDTFSSGYGYTAIVVALLARNNPIGILFASIFFSALSTGSQVMQINSGVSPNMTDVITGVIIFFVATDKLYSYFRGRFPRIEKSPSEHKGVSVS